MDLVLNLNDQLKETKKELGKSIQSKQIELATTPQTVIPIISTAEPSTLATSLAPTLPPMITLPVVGTISTTSTSTNAGKLTEKIDELIRAMEQVSIQAIELKELREQMISLETNYKPTQIQNKEEERKN